MPEPLTWTVLERIAECLEQINTYDGYYTDLGERVSLEAYRAGDLADGEIVRVVSPSDELNDGSIPKGLRGPRSVSGAMRVVIEYVIPASRADAHRQAHRGRADILRALRDDTRMWTTGGVRGFAITSRQILEQPDGYPVVVAQIEARVDITEQTPPPAASP